MEGENTLRLLADSLRWPAADLVPIAHEGSGQLYSIDGLGIAKVYRRDSAKLLSAMGAARVLASTGLEISPRLLDVLELGEQQVVLVFEQLHGMQPDADFLMGPDHRDRLRALLAGLHSVPAERFGREPFASGNGVDDWPTFLTTQLAKVPERFRERTGCAPESFLTEAVDRVREEVTAAQEVLSGVRPALVHRDVSPRNLLVLEGGEIRLLDFDLAAHYDPLFDFVKLALFNPASSRAGWRALFNEYCQRIRVDPDEANARLQISRALELLWGYPALIAMGSKAASTWKHHIQELTQ